MQWPRHSLLAAYLISSTVAAPLRSQAPETQAQPTEINIAEPETPGRHGMASAVVAQEADHHDSFTKQPFQITGPDQAPDRVPSDVLVGVLTANPAIAQSKAPDQTAESSKMNHQNPASQLMGKSSLVPRKARNSRQTPPLQAALPEAEYPPASDEAITTDRYKLPTNRYHSAPQVGASQGMISSMPRSERSPGLPPPEKAPRDAAPGMAPPGMERPGMAPPGMAPPGMAPPGMASPGLPQGNSKDTSPPSHFMTPFGPVFAPKSDTDVLGMLTKGQDGGGPGKVFELMMGGWSKLRKRLGLSA